MISIVLAEDQALVRDGLCALLEMEGEFEVRAVANGQEALEAVRASVPHIVILDIRMPVMDGIACTKALRGQYPKLPILILTTFDDQYLVEDCFEAGANAYLLKDIEPGHLADAVHLLVSGERLIPGDLARALLKAEDSAGDRGGARSANKANHELGAEGNIAGTGTAKDSDEGQIVTEPLTPRQMEVLQLIADGLTNREIAAQLYLSVGTVKNTVSEIYARLGVRDRVQAVLKMLETSDE